MEEFIIDENSNEPMYKQLYNYLRDSIINGEFKPNTTIPSENDMLSLYSVSRVTIRRAVEELEREGYVKKVRGKGAIVLGKRPLTDKNALYGFSETASMRGDRLSYAIVFAGIQEANKKAAEALGIPLDAEIYVLKRFMLINGRVSGLTIAHLPIKEEYDGLFDNFDELSSLYSRLHDFNVILDWAEETIEVLKPPGEVRKALYLDETEPVVYSEHKAYSPNGDIIEFTESYYVYNKFKYSFINKRGGTM